MPNQYSSRGFLVGDLISGASVIKITKNSNRARERKYRIKTPCCGGTTEVSHRTLKEWEKGNVARCFRCSRNGFIPGPKPKKQKIPETILVEQSLPEVELPKPNSLSLRAHFVWGAQMSPEELY